MNTRRVLVVVGLVLLVTPPAVRAAGPLQYFTVTPCRIVDTRDPVGPHGGPALSSGSTRNFAAWGSNAPACGIPASINVRAVTVNATIVTPTNCGFLILWPRAGGSNPPPPTANINFNAGEQAIANGAVVGLGQFSDFQFSAQVGICGGTGTAHLIVDITGYYQ
jgi:hypothetical protein